MKVAILGLDTLNLGKTAVNDPRLDKLKEIFKPPKITPLQIEFVDEKELINADAIVSTKEKLLDLLINDLDIVEMRLASATSAPEKEILLSAKEILEKEEPLCKLAIAAQNLKLISSFNLLTLRPVVVMAKDASLAKEEIAAGVFKDLGNICFFTVNEKELRAWQIKAGTTAWEAAGEIHSDIQRGFIKAEVASYQDLIKAGTLNQVKGAGLLKLEDKDYQVCDGDLIKFRFSV